LTFVKVLIALFEFVGAAVEFGAALVESIRFLAQFDAPFFDLALRGLNDLGRAFARLRLDQACLRVGNL